MCLTAMPTLLHKIQQATIYGAKLTTATVSTGAIQQQGPQQHSCRGTILQLELQLHSSYGNQAWHETTVKCGHRSRSYGKGRSYNHSDGKGRSYRHQPRPSHGTCSAFNTGNAVWDGRGESWCSCRMNIDRHRGMQERHGTAANWHRGRVRSARHRGRRLASPSPWASCTGVAVMMMASERASCFTDEHMPFLT